MSLSIVVKLFRNPWPKTVSDGVLLQLLETAAIKAAERLELMISAGDVEADRDSFGAVLLDPTRPRSARTLADRIMATIEIGPNGAKYLPNGASKADGHDRHDLNMGDLVQEYNHLLGDGEFGWGNSAEYRLAIGGGSGLSVVQDQEMVGYMLRYVIDSVSTYRARWLNEQRRLKREEGHRWFDPDDQPAQVYAEVPHLPSYITHVLA